MEADKNYIFISYSRDDLPKVTPIVEEMRRSGYNVWNDTKILPGEDWSNHIASHIKNCAVCVAFHSQTSRDSPHCREEIHYALKHGKTVISVYLEDVTLKEGLDMQLAPFQSIRYAEPAEPTELLEALRKSPDFERCGGIVSDALQKSSIKKVRQWITFRWKVLLHKVRFLLVAIFALLFILLLLPIYKKLPPIWYLDKGGVLDIVSLPFLKVEMTDYDYQPYYGLNPPPWVAKTPLVKCAIIRKGVTRIGASSFENCSNMNCVFISEGVTSIGQKAFVGCTALKEVNLPYSVKLLGSRAFKGCTGLEKLKLSKGLLNIQDEAFSDCTSLESVDFPTSVTCIGSYAFRNCTALRWIHFSPGWEIGDGIYEIEDGAFSNCVALEEITLPYSIGFIYPYAFSGCSNLKIIHIQSDPEKVQIVDHMPDSSIDLETMYIHTTAFDSNPKIIYEPLTLDDILGTY